MTWPEVAQPGTVPLHALPDDPAPQAETMETLERAGGPPWWSGLPTFADLDAIDYPPLRYLLPGFLPLGGVVLLAGAPKSGKSLLALGAALAVAQGGQAFGSVPVTEAGEVLYVSLDDQSARRAQARARSINRDEPLPSTMRFLSDPRVLGRGHYAAEQLDAFLKANPATRLVVIDTLEHLRAERIPGESAYSGDVRFLGLIRQVIARHPDVCIKALLHTRKGEDEDPIEAVGGTHGVTGGADAVLVLSGKRGAPRRMLDVISRDDEDRRAVLSIGSHGLLLTDEDPDDPTVLLSADDAALYRTLAEFPDGVTAKELSEVLPDITRIGDRLARLAKSGHVRKRGRGVYEA